MIKISKFLELSVKQNASDLHISPGLSPICRIHGELVTLSDIPVLDAETTKTLILGLMTKEQQEIFTENLQIDFSVSFENLGGFRVNAFHQALGIAAVFRVIPLNVPTLEELALPPVLHKLLNLDSGLILVTGPTGCGKSTSLAAMVNHINMNYSRHIITIEDPIEFTHQSKKSLISQRQVFRDATNFSDALRATLREDPDVILVGEMRDLETIRLALTAAETGHLVMATLHTSTAPRAINRVIDVFPAGEKNMIRNLLSESLQGVICQVLISKIGKGRVAAFEVMLGTTGIRNLIREDKIAQMYSAMQIGGQKGMSTFEQSIQMLVQKNIISSTVAQESTAQRDIFDTVDKS